MCVLHRFILLRVRSLLLALACLRRDKILWVTKLQKMCCFVLNFLKYYFDIWSQKTWPILVSVNRTSFLRRHIFCRIKIFFPSLCPILSDAAAIISFWVDIFFYPIPISDITWASEMGNRFSWLSPMPKYYPMKSNAIFFHFHKKFK